MRTLKFRAWDKKQKKMLYGVSIGTVKVWDENAPLISHEFSYSEDCVFEQYTGLKDKNGKEIYEGDIVEYIEGFYREENHDFEDIKTCGVVVWNDEYVGYMARDFDGQYAQLCDLVEVIGNIHENPELLK